MGIETELSTTGFYDSFCWFYIGNRISKVSKKKIPSVYIGIFFEFVNGF